MAGEKTWYNSGSVLFGMRNLPQEPEANQGDKGLGAMTGRSHISILSGHVTRTGTRTALGGINEGSREANIFFGHFFGRALK